ncbi:MAG TPA: pyruvate kinase [bacterium]|nr:pyruvate kinase [bacterium]
MIRKTKIIATVGPACRQESTLAELIRAGVDLFRINASHTSVPELSGWIRLIRKISSKLGSPIPILVDLQGPRLRTGELENAKSIPLTTGATVLVVSSSLPGSANRITTPCRELPLMLKKNDPILIDNGLIELKVLKVRKTGVLCRVIEGGILGENKGINLPNAPVTLPALSAKDRRDLGAAIKLSVDFIALSFVRTELDVMALKDWLKRHGRDIPVIAKIEKPRAVKNIGGIVKCSDGMMVARGDLGIEMGVEKVPFIQKALIASANRQCIPVITATQMLESMMEHSRPTRAEASDIANAVFDGSDAVMLSGETAIGKYPAKAVKFMAKIIADAEDHFEEMSPRVQPDAQIQYESTEVHAITHAARHAAKDLQAKAVLVFTRTGRTVALISRFRPACPIIALTPSEEIRRRLALYRGVVPLTLSYGKNTDIMVRRAEWAVLNARLVKKGDFVVLLSGKNALPSARYFTKILRIGYS